MTPLCTKICGPLVFDYTTDNNNSGSINQLYSIQGKRDNQSNLWVASWIRNQAFMGCKQGRMIPWGVARCFTMLKPTKIWRIKDTLLFR